MKNILSKVLSVAFLLQISPLLFAQDLAYARSVIDTLASKEYAGRGYVSQGDKKAAGFIKNQLIAHGAVALDGEFIQSFTTPVNTFPGAMKVVVNGAPLIPGADYLIDPRSPGISGTYRTVILRPQDLLNEELLTIKLLKDAVGQFIVIDSFSMDDFSEAQQKRLTEIINFIKYHPNVRAAGVIQLTEAKLTWSAASQLNNKPILTLHASAVKEALAEVTVAIENKFFPSYQSQNVIGIIEGSQNDSLVVLTAHYDHLGMMGQATLFPGANDNASGIAMLLSLARHYQSNPPKFSTVFIAFGGEELGLVGSKHFVEHPAFDLSKVKFLLNFDITGTGDEGIQVVNGMKFRGLFDRLKAINDAQELLSDVKIRGEACNSDHCVFDMKGVPCFYIYTLGGIQAYHDIYDKAETLPLTEFEDYLKLLVQFLDQL